MKNNINILLTCVGGELSPQVIQNLKESKRYNIKVIGVDADCEAIGSSFCDKFYTVPLGINKNYSAEILRIVKKEKISLVIPTSDEEAIALSKIKSSMSKIGTKLSCTDIKTLKILIDKKKTYEFLEKKKFMVARWYEAVNTETLIKYSKLLYEEFGEFIVKPSIERGGRNVCIIGGKNNNKSDSDRALYFKNLDEFITNINNLDIAKNNIVMEKLKDPVFDIDLLGWKGKPLKVVARRRVNSSNPNAGHMIVNDKKLISLGNEIISSFNLSWLYDCDVMYNNNNKPCIIEINPRQSGSIAVSLTAGYNLLENLISLSLNQNIDDNAEKLGKKILPYISLKVCKVGKEK